MQTRSEAQPYDSIFTGMKYRLIGPFRGRRAVAAFSTLMGQSRQQAIALR